MKDALPKPAATVQKSGRGVLCPECNRVNSAGRDHCRSCGAGLFVVCAGCGRRNQVVFTRCRQCERRLERPQIDAARPKPGARRAARARAIFLAALAAAAVASVWMWDRLGYPGVGR